MSSTSFSKRQSILVERLEEVCSRIEKDALPTRVEEVWGFGSFFRQKTNPRDLDLGLKCSETHPLWDAFRDLMTKSTSGVGGQQDKYPSPSDALREELHRQRGGEEMWGIFSKWSEGLTWSAVNRDFLPGMSFDLKVVMRRMLTHDLPRISIASYARVGQKFPLVTDALTLVWSRDRADVESNIKAAFSTDGLKENLIVELVGFDQQLSTVKFEIDVRTRLYKSMMRLPPEAFPPDDDHRAWHDWFVSKAQELVPVENRERAKELFEGSFPSLFEEEAPAQKTLGDGAAYRSMSLGDLRELAESKRVELKEGHREIEVLKAILEGAANWKSRRIDINPSFAGYSVEDWLVKSALEGSHKKLVNEEQIRAILRRHGLREDRILTRKGSMTWYSLPENGEEAGERPH